MERWTGRVALVTGASSGIGAAIASRLVKEGLKVIGCAPTEACVQKMKAAAKELEGERGTFFPTRCDLRHAEEIVEMFQAIRTKHGGVDVCVNNAGVCLSTPLLDGDHEQWREMFEVNVLAASICVKEAIKQMRERQFDGHVITISSLAGHRVHIKPGFHVYSMTKHAVKAMTEAVRTELRAIKSNIRVTQISPGIVDTPLHDSYGREETLKPLTPLVTDDIVGAVLYALSQPQRVEVHDVLIRATDQEMY